MNQSLPEADDATTAPDQTMPNQTAPDQVVDVPLDPKIAALTPAVLTPEGADAEIGRLREQIDAIDAEIIEIVARRIALSKQIQAVRIAHSGRRREHSRELKVVNTYVDALGRVGSQLALTLLELSRGPAA